MTAREAAKDLIRVYVLRGETVKQLADSWMGSYNDRYRAHIGSSICSDDAYTTKAPCRRIGSHQIAARPAGAANWSVFSLQELYDEIRAEATSGFAQGVLL